MQAFSEFIQRKMLKGIQSQQRHRRLRQRILYEHTLHHTQTASEVPTHIQQHRYAKYLLTTVFPGAECL
jgi:hypothetical protein